MNDKQEYGIAHLKHTEDIPMMKEALFVSAQDYIDQALDGAIEQDSTDDLNSFTELEDIDE